MFNNLKSGNYDNIEINMNPKRKFLYVDDANFITPSTTAGISQVGYTDDIEITNETTPPSMVLYSSTGLNPKIDFIRGNRTFGNDALTDWRIQNNGSTYLSFSSGKNSTITEEMRLSETDLELNDVDLLVPSTKRIRVERIAGTTPLTSNINIGYTDPTYTGTVLLNQNTTVDSTRFLRTTKFSGSSAGNDITIGDTTSDTGIITSNRDITIATGKKISTPDAIVSSLTASKMVLTDTTPNGKKLISSLYTDTDFARLTANNTMSGANTFSGSNTFSGANIFTGGITTTTSNQVFNLNDSNSLRNLFRFYKPVYETVVNNGATNPQTLATTTANGISYSNGFWSSNAYTPTNNGIVIPNGQPFYFRNQATLTTTFNTDRTNLTSSVQMITGKIIMFIYNTNTSLYEFVGIVNETSVPTSNQFNSKDNSFTLPELRGSNNNILTSNGSGGTSWATSINTGNITATGVLVSGLSANKMVLTDGSDNLVSSLYTDTDFVRLTANNTLSGNNTFSGINTFTNATPILTDKIDGTANSANTLNIGNTTDTTSQIRLNRDTFIGTTLSNKYLRTDLFSGLRNVSDMVIGESGDTGNLNSNRDLEIIDTTKGIFTTRIGANKATLPNANTLNIGYNDTVNYTGIISLNQNTEVPVGRTLKTENIQSNTTTTIMNIGSSNTTANINIGGGLTTGIIRLGTATGGVLSVGDLTVGTVAVPKGVACNYYSSLSATSNVAVLPITTTGTINFAVNATNTGDINIGTGKTTGNISIGTALTTGRLNLYNDKIHIGSGSGTSQAADCIAIGRNAGNSSQSYQSIAIGARAGETSQGGQNLAIGWGAGRNSQQINSTALGHLSAEVTQNQGCVSVGAYSGRTNQALGGVAVGYEAGNSQQGSGAIAIGYQAGKTSQGGTSVAIGYNAQSPAGNGTAIGKNSTVGTGSTSSIAIGDGATINASHTNCIVLNAGFGGYTSQGYNTCVISAMRNSSQTYYAVYSATTGELSYSLSSQKHKYNIKKLERDWSSVLKLRSVEYNLKRSNDHCLGLIAEQAYDVNRDFCIFDSNLEPQAIDWFNIVLYQNEVIKEDRARIEKLEKTDKSIEYNELENKYHDLEIKYNNLSTELQKIKELLNFKFGDVL